jgi:hypothetical protein
VKFWYGSGCGSGSSNPYLCLTDPYADPGDPKTYRSYGFIFGTLVNSHKEVTKQKKSRFFLLFLLDDGRIRSRIREDQEHKDPTDPDRIPNIVGEEMDVGCTRRRILLECFVVMCSIDRPVISLLLSSVLPLEVAQVNLI